MNIFLCDKIFMLTLSCFLFFTVNDPTVDWTVRHGHAIALSAVLHDAVERIMSQDLFDDVTDAAVAHATTDRVGLSWRAGRGRTSSSCLTRVLGFEKNESYLLGLPER